MDSNEVELHWTEIQMAGQIGLIRRLRSVKNDYQPRNGAPEGNNDAWGMNVHGAICEWALAKWLNVFPGYAHLTADVDDYYEVKGIHRSSHGLLCQKDEEKPAKLASPYVLVLNIGFTENGGFGFRMVGWKWGYEVMSPERWNEKMPRPCYRVPQSDLYPMDTLPAKPIDPADIGA